MEYITHSPEETEKIGATLAQKLNAGTVIAYRGDLGAGKTAFTRGLARGLAQGLGYGDTVTSPTDTIVKATPHNCVCGSQRIFCTISAVPKTGNTYSIPAFSEL